MPATVDLRVPGTIIQAAHIQRGPRGSPGLELMPEVGEKRDRGNGLQLRWPWGRVWR